MKNLIAKFYITFSFLFIFSVFSNVHAQNKIERNTIKPEKFEKLMKKNDMIIIDVRTPEEFATTKIPGAINLDVKNETFENQVNTLDKSKTYLLYCRSGKRSETAMQVMQKNGFKKVKHLKGGIENWPGKKNNSD